MARDLITVFQVEETSAERIQAFRLERELGRPPALEIDVLFAKDVAAPSLVGSRAYFSFQRAGEAKHELVGLVEEVTAVGSPVLGATVKEAVVGGSAHAVRLRVVSRMALLSQHVDARIFQDKDVEEIVTQVLGRAGIESNKLQWQLTGSYEKRSYCVQYFESTLDFVCRLLEEEGIYWFTSVEGSDEVIVFTDNSPAAEPIQEDKTLPFRGARGLDAPGDGVVSVRERAVVCSGKFVLRDYDFERPALDLTVTAEAEADTDLERYDYPGLYFDPGRGKRLAQVRLEAEQAEREVVDLLVDSPRVDAGRTFTLGDPPYEEMAGDFLLTRVVHAYGKEAAQEANDAGFELDGASEYLTVARAIPLEVKFRTPQTTARPVIHGPQTARVVGPPGADSETAHTDAHGRIKVKFHWDLGPDQDDKATFWMRTSQLQTSGSMVLPRLDWEVLVEFLEGNPDRPVVTGRLYNGLFMPPYALPEGRTRTTFKTASSPGGGGTNEIRLEDKAGGEEIFVHAQYDQTKKTANDKSTHVGNCATRNIGVDEKIEVGGDETVKITMGSKLTVQADQTITIGGNRNVEVNAVTGINVKGDEKISVGGNQFEMDGNPLQALLQIAAEKAIEVAQAAAGAAMDKINAAIQDKVSQVMAPINELTSQIEEIGASMEALKNGDIAAIADLAAQTADLKLPPGFGGDEPAGEEGGEEAAEGEEKEEGGDTDEGPSYTEQLGVDAAVDSAIETGINAGAAALGDALGTGSAGGGGESGKNLAGPEGSVEGIEATDRAKGPGHNLRAVSGDYKESSGALRLQAAIMGIHTEVGGDATEDVSLAKLQAAWGNITATTGGDQTTKALGQVLFTKGDLSEASTGAATTLIGGILYDKVAGDATIEATGPATFIGAFHKMEASTAITIKVGESEVTIDGSGISISSPLVAILAGQIVLTKAVSEV